MLIQIDTNQAKSDSLEFLKKFDDIDFKLGFNQNTQPLTSNFEENYAELRKEFIKMMLKIGVVL